MDGSRQELAQESYKKSQNNYLTQGEMDTCQRASCGFSILSQNNYLTQGEMDKAAKMGFQTGTGLKITISRRVRWIQRASCGLSVIRVSQNNYLTQGEMDSLR